MKDIINNNNRIHYFLPFSVSLFFLGITLIFYSVLNISFLEDNFDNKKNTKLTSSFGIHEDLSIKDLLMNVTPEQNNLSSNHFNLEEVALNGEVPFFDSEALQKELNKIYDIKTKKGKFIISILPIVAQENEKIRANRKKLLEIKNLLTVHKTLNKKDLRFIERLASNYKINTLNKHKIDTISTLLETVDEIPNSIVLAQAANESGWGTSRFAKEYNALFGEYTFNINNGVVPIYRNDGEKHLVKFFPSVNASIESYFKNLNTHSAYKDFREARNKLRANNLELDPIKLVKHLKFYAEDKNYVKTIRSIIRTNKLIQFDKINTITTKS